MHDTNRKNADRLPRYGLVAALVLANSPLIAAAPPASGQMVKQTIAPGQLVATVGQHLQGPDGSDAGRLWEVLVDGTGRPRAAVIEYGGFAGMGRRKVAVAWPALRFWPDDAHPITLLLNRAELGRIPDFEGADGPITLGGPGAGGETASGH